MGAEGLAAWLVTYAVHGTLLLGGIWLLRAWLRRLPDGIQEALLRFALLAPLVSATLQVTWITEPAAGHLATVDTTPAPPRPSPELLRLLVEAHPLAALEPGSPATAAPAAASLSPWTWLVLAAGFFAITGILLGLRLRFSLWRILRRRRPVNGGPIATELTRLQRQAGLRRRVRLSTCEALQTPIAFGILRPEICLPSRAVELEPEQRAGMLAHELAHIARRDPLWLCAVELLERVFCWQPLIRLVRVRLRELAEFRSDAWAARLTGGLSLARCLVAVADWVAHTPRSIRLVPGMAQGESNLKSRVDRLLDGVPRSGPRGIWMAPVLAGLLVAMTSALPGAATSMPVEPVAQDADDTEPPGLPGLLIVLQEERDSLQAEVEALYDELPADPGPELMELTQELDRRLESLDRRRLQLLDWLLERDRNH